MCIYVYIIIYVLFFLSFLYSIIFIQIVYIYTYNDTAFIMIPTYFIFYLSRVLYLHVFIFFKTHDP